MSLEQTGNVAADTIDGIVMAIRLGVDPIEACRAAEVTPMALWHALLMQETYVKQSLMLQLTQAQWRQLVLAILREPAGGGE